MDYDAVKNELGKLRSVVKYYSEKDINYLSERLRDKAIVIMGAFKMEECNIALDLVKYENYKLYNEFAKLFNDCSVDILVKKRDELMSSWAGVRLRPVYG